MSFETKIKIANLDFQIKIEKNKRFKSIKDNDCFVYVLYIISLTSM